MTRIDGPFPITVNATDDGAELDISSFLIRAVLTQLVTDAAEDPEGVGEELAGIGGLLKSAVHQGRDSHARHEFDAKMQELVERFAAGGTIPLYGAAVGQMRDALAVIAAPRPVPAQREAGAA
ncbi:hypothetical protein EDD90_3245 [Streptomyces sp. Ag109_O5-1]|uniref:hypothetical protein n=1 Tax=Streptomyces sp. Ag109_O5-1 TaxID=1938851 RepID=UPI000F4EE143|nr:hypothetical protein [Streptomyces sp. Ag109_O5-1]RPE40209.1 hypothetical protein EDD90_3245 [Streptomyces sp. Ag109_O5-1]